ncbi:MAG: hypothetical protein ACI4EF_04555 [Coprococcus sp.]
MDENKTDDIFQTEHEVTEQSVSEDWESGLAYNDFGEPVIITSIPEKKKTGLIVGIIAGGVAVAAALIAVIFIIFHKTPEEAVKEALMNTLSEFGNHEASNYNDILGLSDYDTDTLDMVFNGTVDKMDEAEKFEGASVNITGSMEKKDDGTNFSILTATEINGETLNANLYQIGDTLYGELPEIYNAVFAFSSKDIIQNTENSEEIKELYDKYMIPAKENLESAVTYEKVGRTKFENANGDEIKSKQYLVIIPTDAVKEYIISQCNYIKEYADIYVPDEDFEEMELSRLEFDQFMNIIPTYYKLLFPRDIKLNVYVDDKKIVRIEGSYKFTLLGADTDLRADFMGDDYVTRDMNITCGFLTENDKADFIYTSKKNAASDELVTDSEAKFIINGEEIIGMVYRNKYDIASGAYSDAIKMNIDGENYYVDISGNINNVNKGKSFDMNIDYITVKDDEKEYVSVSGILSCGDLGETVAEPDYNKVVSYNELISGDGLDKYLNEEGLDKLLDSWSEVSCIDDMPDSTAAICKKSTEDENKVQEQVTEESSAIEENSGEMVSADDEKIGNSGSEETDFYDAPDEEYKNVSNSGDYDCDIEVEEMSNGDYSSVILETGDYRVAINEPENYERGYADSDGISIYNDDANVYYYIYTDTTIEECYKDFVDTYSYVDGCDVLAHNMETVTLADGTVLQCYVIKLKFDDSYITDMYFFVPLDGTDFVLCNAEIWKKDADINAEAELLANKNVIEIYIEEQ